MVLGAVFLRYNLKNYEIKIRYDDFILTVNDGDQMLTNEDRMKALWDDNTNRDTNFEIYITEKMEKPVLNFHSIFS